MMKNIIDFQILVEYIDNKVTDDQRVDVEKWLSESKDNVDYFNRLKAHYTKDESDYLEITKSMQDRGWGRFYMFTKKEKRKQLRRRNIINLSIAAAVLMLSFGVYFISEDKKVALVADKIEQDDNQVKLIMSDDKIIELDREEWKDKGAVDINNVIKNTEDKSKIIAEIEEEVQIFTIKVPQGKDYYIQLEDGTEVFLNAQSELLFPSKFEKGSDRVVKLIGEGYFDVKKREGSRFIVQVDELDINVLGTQFNINAYNKDFISTVLVEGSVALNTRGDANSNILKPNQQAIYSRNNNTTMITDVDVNNFVSWKSGSYCFSNVSLLFVTESLSKWYGVEFKFDSDKQKDIVINCHLPRYETISELIEVLSGATSLDYVIEKNVIKFI